MTSLARYFGVVGIAVGLLACGSDGSDGRLPPIQQPPSQQPPPTQPPPQEQAPPMIDRSMIPASTCEMEVGITGTAKPGATVIASGGASTSGVSTDAHPATGAFCLPVRLSPGQANLLEVRMLHPDGGLSEAVSVTVTQQQCGGGPDDVTPPGPQEEPRNVALGAPAKSKDKPEKGSLAALTDGDVGTVTEFESNDFSMNASCWATGNPYNGWVIISLDRLVEVDRIVVHWRDMAGGSSAFYGKRYSVLTSSMSDPGDPSLEQDGRWITTRAYDDGDGGIDPIDLSQSKPLVQHVALYLQLDGDCWALDETFAIAEIEVWEAPKASAPPVSPTSVCR